MNAADSTDLLEPPTEDAVRSAIAVFAAAVRDHYGSRLRGIYLYGSRARGDNDPDSDADVAVVLGAATLAFWDETKVLNDLAYDALLDYGLFIQPWPFTTAEWELRAPSERFGELIESARRDAIPLEALR